MRWMRAVLAGLVLAVSSVAWAQEIPFRLVRNMVLLPVKANGVDLVARLDTGGSISLIDPTAVSRLGLVASGKFTGGGLGGRSVRFDTTPPVTAAIGDLSVTSKPLVIFDMRKSGDEVEDAVDITLGMDLIKDLVMEIDFDRSVIRFTPSAKFVAPSSKTPIKIRRVGQDRTILASITNWQNVRADFDTGNPGTVEMTATVAKKALQGQALSNRLAAGVDGAFVFQSATLPSFSLEGLTLTNVPVTIRPRANDRIGLGLDILKRFNLILDFSHDRMWMSPNSKTALPYRKDRLGIWTRSKVWPRKVLLVSPGSPAEKAGLKAGDEIKELIDGTGKLIEDTEEIPAGAQATAVMADGSRREIVAADYF